MTLVHGTQEQAFFNGYYDHECYAPLFIFCGHHVLAAKLRASNVDPAAGALEELQRLIAQIRTHWPDVTIVVRGDSAYGREEIMSWCEAQPNVECVSLSQQRAPANLTWGLEQRAKVAYEQQRQQLERTLSRMVAAQSDQGGTRCPGAPAGLVSVADYRTQKILSCSRRLVCNHL